MESNINDEITVQKHFWYTHQVNHLGIDVRVLRPDPGCPSTLVKSVLAQLSNETFQIMKSPNRFKLFRQFSEPILQREKIKMEKQSLKGITIKKDASDIRRAFEGSVHDGDYEYQDFAHTTEILHSTTVYSNSYDGDDEVFLETEETSESSVRITREPRHRRISDVIDSIGDSSPVIDMHFKFPDFTEGTSDYSSNHLLSSSRFQSPPITPGSDVGYYSTGLSTPPSILNYKMMWSRTDSPVDALKPDEFDGTKWDDTDAKPLNAQEMTINSNPTKANIVSMPVAKNSSEYNMGHLKRGEAVILNNENFKNTSMQSRKGSNFDVDKLSTTLKLLGFNVTIHNDLGYQDIRDVIDQLLKQDYTHCDCLLVAVLTHGRVDNYLHSKDHLYPLDMIWKPFSSDNCPTLAGKPKIFLIQACKGEGLDSGTRLVSYSSTETDSSVDSYTIPTMADFLIAFSTVEGFYSWRNPENGTWFIRSFCDVLEENFETMDLLKMMTIVARRVALGFESFNDVNPSLHGLKQVPSIYSTLIRDVYFRPKAT